MTKKYKRMEVVPGEIEALKTENGKLRAEIRLARAAMVEVDEIKLQIKDFETKWDQLHTAYKLEKERRGQANLQVRALHDALEWCARSLNAIGQSKGLVADHGDALDTALGLLCGCTVGSHFKDCKYGFEVPTKKQKPKCDVIIGYDTNGRGATCGKPNPCDRHTEKRKEGS